MNSKEFLINRLNTLGLIFSNVKIRYEYREYNKSHIIEVIPINFYETSKEYMKAEIELEKSFERLFPNEEIVFVSEGSLTEIRNPEFEFGYDKFSYKWEISIVEEVVTILDNVVSKVHYALAA